MPRHALDSPPSSAARSCWPGSAWPPVPAAASADSLVYIKSGNVWLSQPDGTDAYQVTTDGTPDSPYRSPSQADDGTIAAGRHDDIVRMTQNGTVLNRIDPDPLVNSVSHPVDGPPLDVAISPDGKRIAYTFTSYECPAGASCGARSATSYTAADRYTLPGYSGSSYFRDTSWVTNSRTLQFGGYGSQVNLHDVGSRESPSTGSTTATTSTRRPTSATARRAAGHRLRGLRGYGDSTHLIWYRDTGDVRSGTPGRAGPVDARLRHRPGGRDRRADVVARRARRSREPISSPRTGSGSSARPRDCTVQPTLAIPGPAARLGPRRTSTPRRGPSRRRPGPAGERRRPAGGGVTAGPLPTQPASLKVGKAQARQGAALRPQGHAPRRAARQRAIVAKRGRRSSPRHRQRRRRRQRHGDPALHQGRPKRSLRSARRSSSRSAAAAPRPPSR